MWLTLSIFPFPFPFSQGISGGPSLTFNNKKQLLYSRSKEDQLKRAALCQGQRRWWQSRGTTAELCHRSPQGTGAFNPIPHRQMEANPVLLLGSDH